MKVVILLAGKGRRFQKSYGSDVHKALIPILEQPLLSYLINNIKRAGLKQIIPVLGYKGQEVLACIQQYGQGLDISPVWNDKYENTNNLYSLLQVHTLVNGTDFIMINGDMVFDWHILQKVSMKNGACIAVDINSYQEEIDSPRVLISNNKIIDLGRNIHIDSGSGYAIGIYKFSKDLAEKFFEISDKLVKKYPNMGFHDPLCELFSLYNIEPCITENYLWTDIDDASEIPKIEHYIRILYNNK